MKPSERIREIQKINRKNYIGGQFTEYPVELAIMDYLDEEYEKNSCNRGEHDGEVWNDMYKCKKCGAIYV